MLKSTRFQAVVLLTLGVLLGYAAASGRVRHDWFARPVAPPASRPTPAQ